jgi:hypothetical protein
MAMASAWRVSPAVIHTIPKALLWSDAYPGKVKDRRLESTQEGIVWNISPVGLYRATARDHKISGALVQEHGFGVQYVDTRDRGKIAIWVDGEDNVLTNRGAGDLFDRFGKTSAYRLRGRGGKRRATPGAEGRCRCGHLLSAHYPDGHCMDCRCGKYRPGGGKRRHATAAKPSRLGALVATVNRLTK